VGGGGGGGGETSGRIRSRAWRMREGLDQKDKGKGTRGNNKGENVSSLQWRKNRDFHGGSMQTSSSW